MSFSVTSPFSFLLTHSTPVLLCSFTVRMMVLLIVLFETVVLTKYSEWFCNSGHLMVGKGNPWLIHIQARNSDWFMHPELLRIFGFTAKNRSSAFNEAYSKLITTFAGYDNNVPFYLQVTVTLAFTDKVVFGCFVVQVYCPVCSAVTFGNTSVALPLLVCRSVSFPLCGSLADGTRVQITEVGGKLSAMQVKCSVSPWFNVVLPVISGFLKSLRQNIWIYYTRPDL